MSISPNKAALGGFLVAGAITTVTAGVVGSHLTSSKKGDDTVAALAKLGTAVLGTAAGIGAIAVTGQPMMNWAVNRAGRAAVTGAAMGVMFGAAAASAGILAAFALAKAGDALGH